MKTAELFEKWQNHEITDIDLIRKLIPRAEMFDTLLDALIDAEDIARTEQYSNLAQWFQDIITSAQSLQDNQK